MLYFSVSDAFLRNQIMQYDGLNSYLPYLDRIVIHHRLIPKSNLKVEKSSFVSIAKRFEQSRHKFVYNRYVQKSKGCLIE